MPTIQQNLKQVNAKIWIELRLLCTHKGQQASVPYSVAQYSSWMDSSNNGKGFVAEKTGALHIAIQKKCVLAKHHTLGYSRSGKN